MAESVNVRIPEKLKNFINQQTGLNGFYESASEYIRDLIRKDYEIQEQHKWNGLYEELQGGINADESQFAIFNPDEIINMAKKEQS